jgi:hypothetical protein
VGLLSGRAIRFSCHGERRQAVPSVALTDICRLLVTAQVLSEVGWACWSFGVTREVE